jgi:hypothetical protein
MQDANQTEIREAIEKILKNEKNKIMPSRIETPIKRRYVKEEGIMFTTTPTGSETS